MINNLRQQVFEANMLLPKYGLITFTWGNVSGIDRSNGFIAIKPSGVAYEKMRPEDIVIVDLDGKVIEGRLAPSSDLPTHLELYRKFSSIGGVVHTHSRWATVWAQAGKDIPPYGTTHADYFYGAVPCTRNMTENEIKGAYEHNTGIVITERFKRDGIDPVAMPGAIVKSHGPFTWGKDAYEAVHNAVVLEEIAFMAFNTEVLSPGINRIDSRLLDKHYFRKHGEGAYYGQKDADG